ARGASRGRWRGSGGRGARRSPAWMPGRRLRRRPGRAPPGDGVEVARHLAGPERAVVQVDAPDGAMRHRTALGEIRADVELRARGETDLPVVDRLADQLPAAPVILPTSGTSTSAWV